ncbi:MAG: S8 family serine peptidase [Ancrocorticia sp.]
MTQCSHRKGRTAAALTAVIALSTAAALPVFADDAQPSARKTGIARTITRQANPAPLNATELYAKAGGTAGFTGRWFVELEAEPTIMGGAQSTIQAQQEAFAASVAPAGIEVEDSYGTLWSGVTVTADEEALAKVVEGAHVKAVFPVLLVARPAEAPQSVVNPNMHSARDITGVSLVQNEFGLTGEGVRIGVIDTGIDIDSTVFGGTGVPGTTPFPNSKVVAGYDLVGDDYNDDPSHPNYNPVREPDALPDDCGGHGTHVAGIAAGHDTNSDFVGVATEATLGAYRVFGCEGAGATDVILEAMELAAKDGMDVINMSLGSDFEAWPNYPDAVAADNLVAAGIHVVAAQGNSGRQGLFSGGSPASGRDVIAVGSVDNIKVNQLAFRVGDALVGYAEASDGAGVPESGELEFAVYPEGQKLGGVDLPGEPFTGKAVLVSRGESSFYTKAAAAQGDGAAAVIIYNNQPGIISPTVEGDPKIEIPVVVISQEEGASLDSLVSASSTPITMEWTSETTASVDDNGGRISEFSSWGVTGELDIKPEVLAPGGNIYSAYPADSISGDGSGFATISGTSMATPHVAGVVALLLQANPGLDPAGVRAVLMNTATPVASPLNLGSDEEPFFPLEPIHREGAGLIDVPRALIQAQPSLEFGRSATPSTITPSKINLRDGDAIETTTLTITNTHDEDITYKFSVDDSTINTFGPNAAFDYDSMFDLAGVTTFSSQSVTVPAGESRSVEVTIGEPLTYWGSEVAVEQGALYGGFIRATGSDNSNLSVPFFGVVGDYESDRGFILPTLGQVYGREFMKEQGQDPDAPYSVPLLATACHDFTVCERGSFEVVDAGYSFDIASGDLPGVAIHIENPIRALSLEAFHANEDGSKGAPVSTFGPFYHVDAAGATPGYSLQQWDGTRQNSEDPSDRSPVAEGDYVVEVTAIKGMGEATKSENTESWLSQPFTVVRDGAETRPLAKLDNGWDGKDLVSWVPLPKAEDYYVGDWDGDGVASLMWRTGNTFSYVNTFGDKPVRFDYGRAGDVALIGDWDGDGKDSVAVRRGVLVYHKNALAGGIADDYFYFGRADDVPLAGDWDGDGKDTVAMRRGVTYFVNNALAGGAVSGFDFGSASDRAIGGDWDGNGTDTIALLGDGQIFVNNAPVPSGDLDFQALPLTADDVFAGDWNDDGADTLGYVWYE